MEGYWIIENSKWYYVPLYSILKVEIPFPIFLGDD